MKYTLEIDVDQPRDRIGELFGDPQNLAYWQPGFIKIESIDGATGKPGDQSKIFYKHGSRDVALLETIEVNNLPEEFTATFETKGMCMKVANRFSESEPGKTHWISENEVKVSGFMMRLITIIMPGCFKKQSFKYMENFKAFAEEGKDVRDE